MNDFKRGDIWTSYLYQPSGSRHFPLIIVTVKPFEIASIDLNGLGPFYIEKSNIEAFGWDLYETILNE